MASRIAAIGLMASRLSPSSCACLHLRQASRRVTQLFDDALRPVGLRATQFTLLTAVHRLGPVPIQQLAQRLVMDRTTLTRNL
jgi:DNA-binding MarR family transcriptional regulator